MKKLILSALVILLTLNTFAQQIDQELAQKFEKLYFEDSRGTNLPYRFLRPDMESLPNKKFPVLLFLHGAGERGSDNEKQLAWIEKVFGTQEFMDNFQCYVIIPQCAENFRWCETDWRLTKHTMPAQISKYLNAANELLDSLIASGKADTARLYITGMSMGGYGTWDLISRYPDKFAAAMPICGGADEQQACKLKNLPIKTFHGNVDKAVPVVRSRNIYNAITKCGGQNIEYKEFAGKGHFIWNIVYGDKSNLEWLFSNVKK